MKIAVSGKGGVGKTTLAAGLIRILLDKGFPVFAVDADPDLSLGTLLGFSEETIARLKPIVEMRDLIAEKVGGSTGFFTMNPEVEDIIRDFTLVSGQLRFLKMGAVKKGGSSCYCRENSVLNALMTVLVVQQEEYVVMDMGAGIEHLTRGTARGVDWMLIVTEPSRVSLNTARTVKELSQDIGVRRIGYIGNKVRDENDREYLVQALGGENLLGCMPFNTSLLEESRTGVMDRSFAAVAGTLEQILEKILHSEKP